MGGWAACVGGMVDVGAGRTRQPFKAFAESGVGLFSSLIHMIGEGEM